MTLLSASMQITDMKNNEQEIMDRADRVYKNLIEEIDNLYRIAVDAGANPRDVQGPAHRACGSALALRVDIKNIHDRIY